MVRHLFYIYSRIGGFGALFPFSGDFYRYILKTTALRAYPPNGLRPSVPPVHDNTGVDGFLDIPKKILSGKLALARMETATCGRCRTRSRFGGGGCRWRWIGIVGVRILLGPGKPGKLCIRNIPWRTGLGTVLELWYRWLLSGPGGSTWVSLCSY